jgi:hypothetical protein
MKALIYRSVQPNKTEWLVIINPDTDDEKQISNCTEKKYAIALCDGLGIKYDVAET